MSEPLIDCRDVVFRYNPEGFALKVPQFCVMPGETVFLQGNSGSGKSTVLNLLAGVLKPQAGSVRVLGSPLETLSSSACDRVRVDHMGFVFQQFNLLGYLSVLDNVLLPCEFSAYRKKKACLGHGSARSAGLWLLKQLGLAGLENQAADALSVGQQQRVAAARALIGQPEIIIADEPTSALDPMNQAHLMSLILGLAQQEGCAVVCVSHDPALAPQFHRQVHMDPWQLDQVGQGA